ncbi:glycosyltransferase [Amnibacterium endophyticum]|uniref:Glycosyltransferase n=1 Tax=Amnibacterium endophyticum TaxID=2109337 RepID=A0ABW4LBB2_9MICO
MSRSTPVVILSTADFDSTVWTNKQHLATRLAEHREVTYVESFGLRRPTLTRADAGRIARRLLQSQETPTERRQVEHRPEVVSPVVVPFHGSHIIRRLNRQLVDRLVVPRLPREYILWSFSPLTYGLEDGANSFVYHSVDLIHHQPHMPSRSIVTAERRAVRRADVVIASSTGVRNHLLEIGAPAVRLWENVADTRLFAAPQPRRRPRAVFAGHLTPTKIDIAALRSVVDAEVDLVVCGPLPEDGTSLPDDIRALLEHPRTEYLGNLPPERLAEVFSECVVGLIPYLTNPYTSGVFPLKVYEYLAAGLSIVTTPLGSLDGTDPALLVRSGSVGFGAAAASAIEEFEEAEAMERRALAASHSWESRTEQALAVLNDLC